MVLIAAIPCGRDAGPAPGVAVGWGVSVEAEPGSNLLPNLVMAPARPASRMRA